MEYNKSGIYILITLFTLMLSGIFGCSIVEKKTDSISIKELTAVLPMSSGLADKLHDRQ
jgi:hypothetical protein